MKARILFAAVLLLAAAATAHAQSITVEKPSCIPEEDNGVVKATASGVAPGQTPRLYFRWKDHEDFYWVALEPEPGGRFWATPPKPEKRNEQVEIYGAIVDATGKVVARSESQIVKVTPNCNVRLTEKERGVAENLTVGETSPKQEGKKVMAFLCDGVVTRINSSGIRRSDGVCRACVIAYWPRIVPVVATGFGVIGCVAGPCSDEPSPSRP
jgi:hypothetical protein